MIVTPLLVSLILSLLLPPTDGGVISSTKVTPTIGYLKSIRATVAATTTPTTTPTTPTTYSQQQQQQKKNTHHDHKAHHEVNPDFDKFTDHAKQHHTTEDLKIKTMFNVLGLGFGFPGFLASGVPSDSNGDVGRRHYIQSVNSRFGVFDKVSGSLVLSIPQLALWTGLGTNCDPLSGLEAADPIAIFDQLADRWVMAMLVYGLETNSYSHCIAVSETSDALGGYYQFDVDFGTVLPDYPKASVWPDGYYFTYVLFQNATTFLNPRACVLDRWSILNGNYRSATLLCFDEPQGIALLPSDIDGSTPPPPGSPNYLLQVNTDNCTSTSLSLFKIYLDWIDDTNAIMVGPSIITVLPYTTCSNDSTYIAQQPGTTFKLDTIPDRLMYRLVYRKMDDKEILLASHTLVTKSGIPNVRWYELHMTRERRFEVYQQSSLPDNNQLNRYIPTIAMDKKGNIAIGYTGSDAVSVYPSIFITGRNVRDELNTTRIEKMIFGGKGSERYAGGNERWGDYISIAIDPVDDCTFYYTNQYLATNNFTVDFPFSTRIIAFKFEGCE